VSSLWSISNQFNNFKLNNGQWNNNWNFQPVLPLSLTKDWNLITRPLMPFYNIVPHETAPGQFERAAGLGDLAVVELLSPAHSGNSVLGAGPTFIFPTATSEFTGQGKWQAGPSVVAGYLTKVFFLGVFPQQWWSVGGQHGRVGTNQLNLQPIAAPNSLNCSRIRRSRPRRRNFAGCPGFFILSFKNCSASNKAIVLASSGKIRAPYEPTVRRAVAAGPYHPRGGRTTHLLPPVRQRRRSRRSSLRRRPHRRPGRVA